MTQRSIGTSGMGREVLWEVANSSLQTALSTGEALREALESSARINSAKRPEKRSERDSEIVLESISNLHRLSKAFVKVCDVIKT